MILLPEQHYYKLKTHVLNVDYNNLFALAVIDRVVSGRVYVDNTEDPKTYYIVHRYGMSLLGGDHTNEEFNRTFFDYVINKDKSRTIVEWMQVYPVEWNEILRRPELELNTRVNFVFDPGRYYEFRNSLKNDNSIRIERMSAGLFDKMNGTVTPKVFWNSFEDFNKNGVGFCLFYNNELAATSFSSFLAPGKLELGIETVPGYRGRRLAERICVALLDYCLANNLEPLWACRLENTGSYVLAKKLGFVVAREMPYYRLDPGVL
ncbi:MAG: GNAT family N-acetyltransferase [Bacteroidota bacterium]